MTSDETPNPELPVRVPFVGPSEDYPGPPQETVAMFAEAIREWAGPDAIGYRESSLDGHVYLVGDDGHSYTFEEYADHLGEYAIDHARDSYDCTDEPGGTRHLPCQR
jgi:hypothetical protein